MHIKAVLRPTNWAEKVIVLIYSKDTNNYSESAKYDENQQTKNQRLSII